MTFTVLCSVIFLSHFAVAYAKDIESSVESFYPSPLKQFKAGIVSGDVICKKGLQIVVKLENNYPACVKSETKEKLIEHGWAENLSDSFDSSTIRLYLFTNSTSIYPGQTIGIDISVNNTSSKPVMVYEKDNWAFGVMMLKPCLHTPVGLSILDGYYTQKNMTVKKQLPIYSPTALCPPSQNFVKSYEFQSLSNQAKIDECVSNTQFSCSGTVKMKYHVSFNGLWETWNVFHPFSFGTYTIVGGDEWGHIVIQHFKVVNSTKG